MSLEHTANNARREAAEIILFRGLIRDLVFFELRHGFYKDRFYAEDELREFLTRLNEKELAYYMHQALEKDEYLKKLCAQALKMRLVFDIRDDLLNIKNWEAKSERIRSLLSWLSKTMNFSKGVKIFGYTFSYSRYVSALGSTFAKYLFWLYISLVSVRISKYLFYTRVVLHKRYDHEALADEIKKKIKIKARKTYANS